MEMATDTHLVQRLRTSRAVLPLPPPQHCTFCDRILLAGDVTGTCQVLGDMVTIAGDQYLKVRHVNMLPDVRDMKVYASNLFTGSDELSE